MDSLKGRFITFEGGEGAGKSTQIKFLEEWLAEQDITTIVTREPGGTKGAELIRDLLVTGNVDRWDNVTEALLFMAARRDNLQRVIWPAMERNEWVISDRFVDSTIAYQGYGHGDDINRLWSIYKIIADDFMPDLTIYLDIDPEEGIKRTAGRQGQEANENRFESIDLSFHKRLRAGYLSLAQKHSQRYVVIDASQPLRGVQDEIRAVIKNRLLGA